MRSLDDICSFKDVDFALRAHGLQSRAKGRKTAANMATLLAQIAEQSLAASVCDEATRKVRQEDISKIKQPGAAQLANLRMQRLHIDRRRGWCAAAPRAEHIRHPPQEAASSKS